MSTYELAALAQRVREAQRAYFRHRSSELLAESKRLERELDAAVNGVLNPVRVAPTLFDADCTITEDRIRDLMFPTNLLDDEDYRLLVNSANADADEGAEWLPYYKVACALLMQAFGMAEAAAVLTNDRGQRILAKARGLVLLSQRAAGIGPQEPTPELVAKVDSINANLFR